jgi:DNA-binding GntR family transcriptional regulator
MSLQDRSAKIDRSRPLLLSEQVADDLRGQISVGEVTGRLPNEQELASQYGVSRVTVRTALAALVDEGLVVSIHGRGTFIAER